MGRVGLTLSPGVDGGFGSAVVEASGVIVSYQVSGDHYGISGGDGVVGYVERSVSCNSMSATYDSRGAGTLAHWGDEESQHFICTNEGTKSHHGLTTCKLTLT